MITDLAVPESPTNIVGILRAIFYANIKLNLFVSAVGTNIFENLPSAGG